MAYITKEYYESLKEKQIIQFGDWLSLSKLSKQAGLRKGKGYTRQTVQKIVAEGINTSDEMIALIRMYYEGRIRAFDEQLEMAKTIKMRESFA